MKAVYINEFGGIENLEFREVDDLPDPADTEILVNVMAAGLNRADILQRKGLYPAPGGYPERIPGLEFAGRISKIGKHVKKWEPGDRVFGITAGGGQAEFVLTGENQVAGIPEGLSFAEAAAIPEAFITAHDAVWIQGHLKSGESLMIHAVGSGVGAAALQIAKAKGIKTFGTSRTQRKLEKCKEFGLDLGIDTSGNIEFAEIIRNETGGSGADVILDLVGADYFGQNLACLSVKGRLMLVGLVSGRKAEFDMGIALTKRLHIIGTVLRARTETEKALATQNFIDDVLPLIASGSIKPNLDKVYGFQDVGEAHAYLESNASFGKVVLRF